MRTVIRLDWSDDDLAALGFRHGKKRATRADVVSFVEGVVDGVMQDVMEEYRQSLDDDAGA